MAGKCKASALLDVVVDKPPGGNVETLSEGGRGEGEGDRGASWRIAWIAYWRTR
jgi:hypothetical protein